MARKIVWQRDGQTVTSADVRRWMQSVAARVPKSSWPRYIKLYDVVGKIARHKAKGLFESVVAENAARNAVFVRQARRPGTLQRLRKTWVEAANQSAFGSKPAIVELEKVEVQA